VSFEDDHGFVVSILMHSLLLIKVSEMHNFSNLFDKALSLFRTGPLSIIGSISTVYMQYVFVMLVLLAVC